MNQSSGPTKRPRRPPGRRRGELLVERYIGRLVGRGHGGTNPIDSLANFINGVSSALSGSFFGSNIGNLTQRPGRNWASAGSALIGLGGGGLLTALAGPATAGSDIGGLGSALAGNVAPRSRDRRDGRSRRDGRRTCAGRCRSRVVDRRPVGAATWAGGAGIPGASTPVTLASQSWATPHRQLGGMSNGIAGMPAVANGGRGGSSFGAPRYGVKPKVMRRCPSR